MTLCQFGSRFRLSSVLILLLARVAFVPDAVAAAAPEPTATPTPIACVGDCNDDGTVTVDEILIMVNVALGLADVSTCSAGDANGDGQIGINEILSAVSNALNSCPPSVSSTPTPAMHTVVVGPDGQLVFQRATLSIHVGDTVQWTWASSGHSVNSGSSNCVADGQFCSPNDSDCAHALTSNQGATYSHTFNAPGMYPYFCSPHCELGMVGTINVE